MTSGSTGETTLSGLSSLRALTSSTRYTECVGCVGVCVWGDGGGCVCVGWVGVHGIQVMAAEKIEGGGESCS